MVSRQTLTNRRHDVARLTERLAQSGVPWSVAYELHGYVVRDEAGLVRIGGRYEVVMAWVAGLTEGRARWRRDSEADR